MSLREQIQAFRFVGGVDTRTDPFAVTPTKLAIAENCSFASTGRVRKLPGFAALSRDIAGSGADLGESIANGGAGPAQALMPYRGELLAADLSRLYSYDVGSAQWIDKGRLASINVTKNAVNADTFDNYGQDGAVHSGGLQCYLWNGYNDGLYYAVLDTVTGQLVVRGTLITTTGTRGRVLVSGNTFFLMYYDTSATTLKFATLAVGAPTATLSFSALTTSTADANGISNSAPNYDATLITSASAGAQLYIAFNNRLAGGGLSLWRSAVSTPTANVAKVSITGEVASNAITVFEDRFGNLPVLAYYNGSAVLFRVYDPRLADASNVPILVADGIVETIANVTSITGASASATATDVRFYYTISAASAANYYVRTATWVGAYVIDPTWWFMHGAAPWSMIDASASAADFLRSVMLAAKAFVYGDQVYVPLVHDSAEQPTYFVADGARNIVARFLAGSAGGVIPVSASAVQSLPSVTTADATTFRLALRQERIVGPSLAAPPVATICSIGLDFFEPSLSYPRAELAQNLHVGGGFLSMYDGVSVVEHGFHLYPETLVLASPGSTHTYQYTACYEWTDNEGQIHRSAPATPLEVQTAVPPASFGLTLVVPTLRLTAKRNDTLLPNGRGAPQIILFRTEDNGTAFYRCGLAANDPTADSVSIADSTADATLIGQQPLYTTGGVLDNAAAPPFDAICAHRNRIVGVDSTNPLILWVSKEVTAAPDTLAGAPVEFAAELAIAVDPAGGDVTALASLDATLVVFKRARIFGITGRGPTSAGLDGDWSDAQLISTACGCANPRSVVTTPAGLIFQSLKGFWLLSRDLRASYIGADVDAYNGETVTSAVLLEDSDQVRFTLGNRTALIFDYADLQWGVRTNLAAVDSVIWDGQHTYLRADGTPFTEDPETFTDGGSHVRLRVRTAWLQFAGIQGLQRIWEFQILGEYFGPHKLRVEIAYDFNPNAVDSFLIEPEPVGTFGDDSPFGEGSPFGGEFPLYQYRVFPTRQQSMAMQITISDVPDGAPGESMSLSALSFSLGVSGRLRQVPASRST